MAMTQQREFQYRKRNYLKYKLQTWKVIITQDFKITLKFQEQAEVKRLQTKSGNKDKSIEIIQSEEYREQKYEKKNEQSLRILQDIKSISIHVIRSLEGERQRAKKNIFAEIMVDNVLI